jgi:hypothetical protein
MILRHAIKYLELNGSDFITDLDNFSKLQRSFMAGYIPDDFTEDMESFIDRLLLLWIDCKGGMKSALEDELELPKSEELLNEFCKVIFPSEEKDIDTVFFSSSSLLRKKEEPIKTNKTLELLVILVDNEIDFNQFLDMELELIYKVVEQVAEKKKEEREKERKRKRKGM